MPLETTPTLSTDPIASTFSRDEIETLCSFMSSLDTFISLPQTSYAQLGTSASAFSASTSTLVHSWIIDSGLSDHMTDTSSFFFYYSICSEKDKVCIANESYCLIVGKGSIPVTCTLRLSSVLHVRNFTLNLLSVSHLTKSLN